MSTYLVETETNKKKKKLTIYKRVGSFLGEDSHGNFGPHTKAVLEYLKEHEEESPDILVFAFVDEDYTWRSSNA